MEEEVEAGVARGHVGGGSVFGEAHWWRCCGCVGGVGGWNEAGGAPEGRVNLVVPL